MSGLATTLPVRRTELVIRPLGERGRYVVKDPATGAYFHLGDQEHFLLEQLDGEKDPATIRAAFTQKFAQSLSEQELDEFVELARGKGFLAEANALTPDPSPPRGERGVKPLPPRIQPSPRPSVAPSPRPKQSILYWRKSLFDPDRLCTWLAPRLWFFWTRTFLVLSAGCIGLAAFLFWANRFELATSFQSALRWESVLLVWMTLLAVTTLHEFAHGLTCKHHGGEVHEIGFLLLFFMPCFYCNVSDAWLFRERSKRLWVTFAGGYFELFLWALAVFAWRLSVLDSLLNYVAFVVLSVCGVQTLFNFNPLLKLDGYYLLSDWLEIPNLQQRALDSFKGRVRWLLWGACRSARGTYSHTKAREASREKLLFRFGLATWLYSLTFLALMFWAFLWFFWSSWGWLGLAALVLLAWASGRRLFHGLMAGEVRTMITKRRIRTACWLLLLGGLSAVLYFVEMEDRVSGTFQVRPLVRAELRAPVAGFLKEVHFDEGERVSPGVLVARLEVPELTSRIAQKRAEVREAQARLRLLEVGPRPEEVIEQRGRVERMKAWRDLARKDLEQARRAFQEELARLDQQIVQYRAEVSSAKDAFDRTKNLLGRGASAEEQYQEADRRYQVAQALLAQAQSQKRHREALGTREAIAGLDAEAELARREKDLADAQSTLTLLEAGTRPEAIDAEKAHLARLQEEARYLEELQGKLQVVSPASGLVMTPYLKEKVGQYVREGDLICLIEEPTVLQAEIALSEQDVTRVVPGQAVDLKVRALPYDTLQAQVERIAPSAGKGDVQSTVTVYCRLQNARDLKPGMTGHARVYTARRPTGAIVLDGVLRFVRTEFWW